MTDPTAYRLANYVDLDSNGTKDDMIVHMTASGVTYEPVFFETVKGARQEMQLSLNEQKRRAILAKDDFYSEAKRIYAPADPAYAQMGIGSARADHTAYVFDIAGDIDHKAGLDVISVMDPDAVRPVIVRTSLKAGVDPSKATAADYLSVQDHPRAVHNVTHPDGSITRVITLK